MTTPEAATSTIEMEPWSADLADAEFARLVQETRVVTPLTRVLIVVLVAAAGFIGGVLVERNQQPAAAASATTSFPRTAAGAQPNQAAQPGQGGQGAGATVGTITLIDGPNVYVTTAEGDVVKVITNPQTSITVSKTGALADLDPSKTVAVQGTTNPDGTVTATQITQGGFGAFGGGRRNGGAGAGPSGSAPNGGG